MNQKRTILVGVLVLGLMLLAPPPGHAQPKTPGELVGTLIGRVAARWGALWPRDRPPVWKQCEHGTSIDPNGCPVGISSPSSSATEAGASIDPNGSAGATETGPDTDPNG